MQLCILFPRGYCNFIRNQEEREMIYYFARLITYCMGLEDRFNIFGWPTDQLEAIIRRDFRDNIYRVIVNEHYLLTIQSQTLHQDISKSNFHYLWYTFVRNEILYLAKYLKTNPSLYKNNYSFTLYYYFKYFISNILFKLPGLSFLMILLSPGMYKYRFKIIKYLSIFD